MGLRTCLSSTRNYFTLWFAVLVPILLIPLPLAVPNSIGRCAYCVIVIALFWVTEVIPLAVTSLLPVVLFPMMGIMTVKDVCSSFMTNTLMLFLGSLVVAVAVEKWNLHRRLALRTLTLVGPEPKWLLMGVMFPTWFLSMWMSNTASAAMMMPIVSAILLQIKECQAQGQVENGISKRKSSSQDEESYTNAKPPLEQMEIADSPPPSDEDLEKQFMNLAKTFTLATAYSANIGGMATLTGTPPNIIFKRFADRIYKDTESECPVNFANWLAVGVPLSLILIIFCWFWLQVFSQGLSILKCGKKDKTSYESVRQVLRREYDGLGPIRFPEVLVMICFVLLALLWVTRNPGFIPGWSSLFRDKYVGDSTPAILIAVILFILPAYPPSWLYRFKFRCVQVMDATEKPSGYQAILDWETVRLRLAWGVLLLMGGGFALADGCRVSGLSAWVSSHLEALSYMPQWTIALLLSMLIAAATEVTSNAATTTLFVPIIGELGLRMGVHPLFFMIPCTIATSLAFLLPVATPPNAIVFASGYLRVRDMVKAGVTMNVFAIIILNVGLNTWITNLYDLGTLPDELRDINITWTGS